MLQLQTGGKHRERGVRYCTARAAPRKKEDIVFKAEAKILGKIEREVDGKYNVADARDR